MGHLVYTGLLCMVFWDVIVIIDKNLWFVVPSAWGLPNTGVMGVWDPHSYQWESSWLYEWIIMKMRCRRMPYSRCTESQKSTYNYQTFLVMSQYWPLNFTKKAAERSGFISNIYTMTGRDWLLDLEYWDTLLCTFESDKYTNRLKFK